MVYLLLVVMRVVATHKHPFPRSNHLLQGYHSKSRLSMSKQGFSLIRGEEGERMILPVPDNSLHYPLALRAPFMHSMISDIIAHARTCINLCQIEISMSLSSIAFPSHSFFLRPFSPNFGVPSLLLLFTCIILCTLSVFRVFRVFRVFHSERERERKARK